MANFRVGHRHRRRTAPPPGRKSRYAEPLVIELPEQSLMRGSEAVRCQSMNEMEVQQIMSASEEIIT